MLELKKCNYITGDTHSVSYGLCKIIDFLDTEGRTPVLLTPHHHESGNTKGGPLRHIVRCSKIEFLNGDDFNRIVSDKSKMFRVDLIIADLWHLTLSSIMDYKEYLDQTGLDYIIVSNKYHYKESDDIRIYEIRSESNSGYSSSVGFTSLDFTTTYFVKDKISGWESTLTDLAKSYIRDKRIDGIIGE